MVYTVHTESYDIQRSIDAVMTPSALAYAWRQLIQRAGIGDSEQTSAGLDRFHVPVCYTVQKECRLTQPGIIVSPAARQSWNELLALPPNRLDWLPAHRVMPPDTCLPVETSIPVLFWGQGYEDGSRPLAERREDGTVVFYADILATAFFMLSRFEETIVPIRGPT